VTRVKTGFVPGPFGAVAGSSGYDNAALASELEANVCKELFYPYGKTYGGLRY
jgi:hypothetical protein